MVKHIPASTQIIQVGKYEPRMLREGAELHPANSAGTVPAMTGAISLISKKNALRRK